MPPVGRGGRPDSPPNGHRGEVGMTNRPYRHYRSHSLPTTDPRSPHYSSYWHHSPRRPRNFLPQSPSLASVPQLDEVRSSPQNTVREDRRQKTDITGLNLLLNEPKAITINQNYYPEGGWGWVVLVCALIFDVILSTLHLSAGFLIVEIRNQFLKGEESLQPVAAASVFLGVSQLLSPIVVALCKKKSTRLLAIFGAIVTSLGCLFTSFATQLHQVYLSYGIFIGSGNSLARETSSIMIGQYFKKRRQQVEMVSLIGYGFGVATMPLLFSYWVRLVGWRRGLQILAGIQCIVSLIAILFRPASLYHPQRRAILHIKSMQKRTKGKDKSYVVDKRPFIDFSVLNSRTLQIYIIGSGITAFGVSAPFIFLVEEMLKDHLSFKSIYMVNIYLGLACSAGSAAFGFIVIQNSAQCMIAKQYLCQGALFILSVWLLAYPTLSGYYGYVLFAVIYGLFYGGYIYTLKLCIFDKVRARNFSRAWSFLLWTQAIPNVIGLPTIYYLNEVLGSKRGYYLSSAVVFLGSLFLFLIDVHKYQAQKKKQIDIEANEEVLEDPVPRPESFHETLYEGAIPKNYGDLRKAHELTCISEEILVENYLEDYIDDCITSCNKEEKYVMLSEFENNLYKTDESLDRDGASCSQDDSVGHAEMQCCNKCAREYAASEHTGDSPRKGTKSEPKMDVIEELTLPV
ncbi:Monocarboxylate transporter 10 [Araneus ventricosus]|uniref:Monocarboxylate transporter 10 n=1 Tax=Araneus ventricosus TaxID=182803 RepID=A0A4Y2BPS6_ARAVE|nr:Monocarboxylate transporter 10 [Araneus ventricosus]